MMRRGGTAVHCGGERAVVFLRIEGGGAHQWERPYLWGCGDAQMPGL